MWIYIVMDSQYKGRTDHNSISKQQHYLEAWSSELLNTLNNFFSTSRREENGQYSTGLSYLFRVTTKGVARRFRQKCCLRFVCRSKTLDTGSWVFIVSLKNLKYSWKSSWKPSLSPPSAAINLDLCEYFKTLWIMIENLRIWTKSETFACSVHQ